MFVTLWEFEVKPGNEVLFEQAYGPDGMWVRLFRQDTRYRGTRLLRDLAAERIYVTMDEWDSREAYNQFRDTHVAEYSEIDWESEKLTVNERHLGEYKR